MRVYPMEEERCISYDDALDKACRQAALCAAAYGRGVLLVDGLERMDAAKRRLAALNCGFGVQVETLSSWVEDLWQLYGTGQQLVGAFDRTLTVHQVLRQRQDAGVSGAFPEAPGMVSLVGRLLRDCAPFFLDRPGFTWPVLSAAEGEVMALVRACVEAQKAAGTIEPALACWLLARQQVLAVPVVLWDVTPAAAHEVLLRTAPSVDAYAIAACESAAVPRNEEISQLSANLYHPDYQNPLVPTGQVRFALPMGAYASPALLTEELARLVDQGNRSIALTCVDPYGAFCQLAPRLLSKGIQTRVKGKAPLARTAFGVAWTSLMRFLQQGTHDSSALASDFVLSLFSFMESAAAQRTDAYLRGWRGLTSREALERVSDEMAEEHRLFLEAVSEGRLVDALLYQRAWAAQQSGWSDIFKETQLAAIDFALEVQRKTQELGMPVESALMIFDDHAFKVNAQTFGAEDAPKVTILSLNDLGKYPPASFDACALCDLSADGYPLTDDEQAVDGLLKKLGCYVAPRKVERLRASFSCAVAAARNSVLAHRVLKDGATEEVRPSALFDDLVDCYRSQPTNYKELDALLGVPACLVSYAASRGEGSMTKNCTLSGKMPCKKDTFLPASQLQFPQPRQVLLPSHHEVKAGRDPHLSASAIEAYLECPFKWYTQRRLDLTTLDAQMDALAKGNFAHQVLHDFHDALQQMGANRVTPETVEEAQKLMGAAFDAQLRKESNPETPGAYFATNNKEALGIERFRKTLLDFVSWEADFLPGYYPLSGEVRFGYDEPCQYAGYSLVGSVDRVDVDDKGNAVVLDYKGSAGAKYNFRLKDADASEIALPPKVQALIYAQVVRRQLGMNPVAALYVSYGAAHGCAGLYDAARFDARTDLRGASAECCQTTAFLDTLDRVEELIAARLERLNAGVIEPTPSDNACAYCTIAGVCQRACMQEGRC